MINPRFFLFSLCSAWMMGLGLRFIIDGYFNNCVFGVNLFDTIFDWGILLTLGIILLIVTVFTSFKQEKIEGGL